MSRYNKKPFAAVSHGSVGGARAVSHLKHIISESRAVIIPTNVAFTHRVREVIDERGELNDDLKAQEHGPQTALKNSLDELKWYSEALSVARLTV